MLITPGATRCNYEYIIHANQGEIKAMKVEVISRNGRKKDFWDIHELFETYSLQQMLSLHEQRYPHSHNETEILNNFVDFTYADDDFDPIWDIQK